MTLALWCSEDADIFTIHGFVGLQRIKVLGERTNIIRTPEYGFLLCA